MPDRSPTPAGDHLRAKFGDWETTHSAATDANAAGCAAWHSLCAYEAGRAEALRAVADDLEADARALEALGGERPWPSMLGGIKVHDSKGGAGLLRRAATMARERASAAPGAPAGTTPVSLDGPEPQNRPQGRREAGP